jgi:hypothetical protein
MKGSIVSVGFGEARQELFQQTELTQKWLPTQSSMILNMQTEK